MMKNNAEIRDEELLLLGLSRLNFTKEHREKLFVLVRNIAGWDYFISLAGQHGISALVLNNLEALGLTGHLPSEQLSKLRSAHLLSISRNAFHISSSEELLSILNSEGIKTVLLKGLALELTVYGNKGLRQMTDVDILIDRKDYLKAQKVLMEKGYDSTPVKSGFHRSIIAWTGKHLPSLMKNGTSIDIHLELFPGKKNDLTAMVLDNSSAIMIDREKVFIPPPQLFFLFLVRHLHQHELNNESQLRLYADLVVMMENYFDEIINYNLLELASRAGISKILAWKLEQLRDLWGISFPGWTDEFIDRWFSPDSINRFVFFLKSPKDNKPEKPGYVYRRTIMEIPGLHRKMLFILGDLFPTIKFMKERYGVKTTPGAVILYPLRLGKLFWLFRK
jgi:hypothetical protein